MAGGPVALNRASMAHVAEYHGRLTWYVIMVAAVAAAGGLLFGYDIGVTGGVEAMETFQQKASLSSLSFPAHCRCCGGSGARQREPSPACAPPAMQFFPEVYNRNHGPEAQSTNPYCVYDDQKLQIFTSLLFLAGLFSSLFAAKVTQRFGRKLTMTVGAIRFLIGTGLCSGAVALGMLIVGRLCLGFGVGFVNQVAPLYLSEMAPINFRGALNVCFQLCITIGILVAQLVNYGTQDMYTNGWRVSLAIAGGPAIILFIGSLLLPESPNYLVEAGHPERARRILERLRGTNQVDAEFNDIVAGVESTKGVRMRDSWRLLFTRRYSPMLIITTGINAIMFYVPVLFSSLGTGRSTALLNTVVIGAVNVGCTIIAVLFVDRFGRRFLLIEGGTQCAITQIIVGVVLGVEFSTAAGTILPKPVARGVLAGEQRRGVASPGGTKQARLGARALDRVLGPAGVAGTPPDFALAAPVPSEIQPQETRSAGTAAAVVSNFLWTFVVGQVFLTMLCSMRYGVFLFFGGMLIIMVLFVIFFVPETKGLPTDEKIASHWFWKKWMGLAAVQEVVDKAEARRVRRKGEAAAMERGAAPPAAPEGFIAKTSMGVPPVTAKQSAVGAFLARASQISTSYGPSVAQMHAPPVDEE
eukprot:scaffold4.g4783.t1